LNVCKRKSNEVFARICYRQITKDGKVENWKRTISHLALSAFLTTQTLLGAVSIIVDLVVMSGMEIL